VTVELEQLLYREAHLLDCGLYRDWLALMATDLRYWAPVRANVPVEQERASEANRLPLFDETKASLDLRISRLETGLAWINTPQSRTRRFISNVMVDAEFDSTLRVRSNFLVFRSRSFAEEWFAVGCREDQWSGSSGTWLLKERKIMFDHCTVENLPLFV